MDPSCGITAVLKFNRFMLPGEKKIRRLWKLPNTIHCSLLPSNNDYIPIEIILDQRCAKFI